MGNYKKTVKCSWCHTHGHNKVTCPKLKEYVESCRQLYGNDHKVVQEYDRVKKRYSKKSSNNARKKRLCSYCFEPHHNRRTCTHLEAHKKALIEKNVVWRQAVLDILKDSDVSVGSLIMHDTEKYCVTDILPHIQSSNKDLWMIIKINWQDVVFFEPCDEIFTISLMKRPSTKRNINLESLLFHNSKTYHSSDCIWRVVSKGGSLNVPKDWLSKDKNIINKVDIFFNDLTKEAYEDVFSAKNSDRDNNLLTSILKEKQDDEKER